MSFVAPISQGLAYHRRIKSDIGSHAVSLSQGLMFGACILVDRYKYCQLPRRSCRAAGCYSIDKDLIGKHATYLPIKP